MRPLHRATVNEVLDEDACVAFQAVCLETGAEADAWGWADGGHTEGDAIASALEYIGDPDLFDGARETDSPHFCDADHVMAHDFHDF